jgi:hypothetical protein
LEQHPVAEGDVRLTLAERDQLPIEDTPDREGFEFGEQLGRIGFGIAFTADARA